MQWQSRIGTKIFIGPRGLRAGWRFLLFAMIVGLLITAFTMGTRAASQWLGGDVTAIVQNYIGIAAALCAMWVMGWIEGKAVWSYGFAPRNRGRNLAVGMVTGFAALSALMGLLIVTGGFQPSTPVLHGPAAWGWAGYWAVLFAGVGLSEESLLRSYPLFSLSQGIGFWPAAAILSVLFGAGHLGNSGEEWIGIGNAMLAGLVFSFSVKWTGSLWWAFGCHATWDWGESFFYGVADSGSRAHHHFLSGDPAGPGWLSGGTVGPEGSVLAVFILLSLAAAVRLTTPGWKNPALEKLARVPGPLAIHDAQDPSGISIA